jgi:phosphoribosylamine--glycine ligase / phosphoribosylglycinamide formyltransferase / phosphoribosylformylglycinamidine cyclo-ligase
MQGRVDAAEMARTFNMGIGMVLVVSAQYADEVQTLIEKNGEQALRIGSVVEGRQKTLINGLESSLLSSYMSWAVKLSDVMPLSAQKRRVGILLSGAGTNMEALVEHSRNAANNSVADIVVVISNKPNVVGIEKARALGIATEVCNAIEEKELIALKYILFLA